MLNIQRLQSRLEKPLKSRSLARSDSFAFLQNFTWVGPSIIWPPSRDRRTSRADCQIECGALSKPFKDYLACRKANVRDLSGLGCFNLEIRRDIQAAIWGLGLEEHWMMHQFDQGIFRVRE